MATTDLFIGDRQPVACNVDGDLYLQQAVANKAASFAQVADAHFSGSQHESSLLQAFERKNGKVTRLHYWESAQAGLVCTEKHVIGVYCHADTALVDPEIEGLIYQCEMLHYEARRLIRGPDLATCSEMTCNLIVHLLGLLEAECGPDESCQPRTQEEQKARQKLLTFVARQLQHERGLFKASAQRQAQFHYFIGMFWGILIIGGGIAATVLAALLSARILGFDMPAWFTSTGHGVLIAGAGCFIAGALGALISVMTRFSSGKCTLQYQAGKSMLRIVGAIRPVIGAVFGAASFMVFQAGLLSVAASTAQAQTGTADPVYNVKALILFWSLAFLAGFSERWAQDMLNIAGKTATGDASTSSTAAAQTSGKK